MTTLSVSSMNYKGYAWNLGVGLTYMAVGGIATYVMDRFFVAFYPNLSPDVKWIVSIFLSAMVAYYSPVPKLVLISDTPTAIHWSLIAVSVISMVADQERLAFFYMGIAIPLLGEPVVTAFMSTLAGAGIAFDTLYPPTNEERELN
jgi:hypothetical protein